MRPERAREPAQERDAIVGQEVSDCAAQQRHQSAASDREPIEVLLEVTDERVDGDSRILDSDLLCRCAKDTFADIERDVELERSVLGERAKEQSGLCGRPGAELDERVGLGDSGHGDCFGIENLGSFLAREALDIAQNNRGPVTIGKLPQAALNSAA